MELTRKRPVSHQQHRGVDPSAVATLVLGLPKVLASLGIVIGIASLLDSPWSYCLVIGWLLSGLTLFMRPVEQLLAWTLFGLRKPTAHEARLLASAWNVATRAAGIDGARYMLWIEPSDEPNAFAAAGHIVAVTKWSLTNTDTTELTGILIHEIAHHLRGHAWSKLIIVWYSIPAAIALRLIEWATRLSLWMLGGMVRAFSFSPVATLVVTLAALPLMLMGLAILAALSVLGLLAIVTLLFDRIANREAELRCDRFAVEAGYGPALLKVLYTSLAQEHDEASWYERMFDTHPAVSSRIRAIEGRLAQPIHRS